MFNSKRLFTLSVPILVAFFCALTWPPERTHPLIEPLLTPIRSLEWQGYDVLFHWRGPVPSDKRIILVGYEKTTSSVLQSPWPPPRRYHAKLIDNLLKDGAILVCIDILLDTPSKEKDSVADDKALHNALARARDRVILASRINRSGASISKSVVYPYYNDDDGIDFEKYAGVGFADVTVHADNILRYFYPVQKVLGDWYPSLPTAAFLRLTGRKVEDIQVTPDSIYLGNYQIPRTGPDIPDPDFPENNMGSVYVDFPGGARSFDIVKYEDVVLGTFPPNTFKNRVVFVGVTDIEMAYAENDAFRTAYSHHSPQKLGASYTRDVYGVIVQAQMLHALLQRRFLRQANFWEILSFVLLFGLASTYAAIHFLDWRGPLLVASAAIGYTFVVFYLFLTQAVFVPFVVPTLMVSLSTAAIAWIERSYLMRRWSGSVSPAYLQVMLREGENSKPTRYKATVVFGDVRGFTAFSERHAPETVIELLDKHLERQVKIIFEEGGTIDKFLGDGILVLFGAPRKREDRRRDEVAHTAFNAVAAVRAAWRMREASFEPVKDEKGHYHFLRAGFGICTGDFVLGFVGSRRQSSLTTIGDTVNLASRLQGITGEADIIVDRTTYENVRPYITAEELGPLDIKGKNEKIHCYRITAFHEKPRVIIEEEDSLENPKIPT